MFFKIEIFLSTLRLLILLYFATNGTITIYLFATDTKVFELPETLTNGQSYIYRHLPQLIFMILGAPLLSSSDLIIVHLSLYFVSSLNIVLDAIKSLSDISAIEKKKKLLLNLYFYHLKILDNLELFSNMLYYVFVVQFSTNFLFFLVTFYMLGRAHNMFFLYPLIIAVFFQFSTFCFFGEVIFERTERIFIELYLTKWYAFSNEDKRMMLMMMMISQKPFGFKAAGMYDVNLMMFLQVVKIAFSYCTILYALT